MASEFRPPDVTSFRALVRLVREDLAAHGHDFWSPGFQAMAVYRLGRWQRQLNRGVIRRLSRYSYRIAYTFIRNVYGIELRDTTLVGRRVVIGHQSGIVIHPGAVIGDDCVIRQNVTLGAASGDPAKFPKQAPVLGRGVSLGAGAAVIGGVVIGDGAQIGPNATILTNVPAGARILAPASRVIPPPPGSDEITSARRNGPVS